MFLWHKIGAKHQLLLYWTFKTDTKPLKTALFKVDNISPSLHGALSELSLQGSRTSDWGLASMNTKLSLVIWYFSSTLSQSSYKMKGRLWNRLFLVVTNDYSFFGGSEASGGYALHRISPTQHIPWKIRPEVLHLGTQGRLFVRFWSEFRVPLLPALHAHATYSRQPLSNRRLKSRLIICPISSVDSTSTGDIRVR